MKTKPVIRRRLAHADIANAITHYRTNADAGVATQFVDELERIISMIAEAPATGSPRFGDALNLPGLRSRQLGRFPFLVFYMEGEEQIEVWRVLHERRDIAESLQDQAP